MSARPTDLERFIAAYIETALWSSTEGEDDTPMMDQNYDKADFAPSSYESICLDCAQFVSENAEVLDYCAWTSKLPNRGTYGGEAYAMAGHDFWLTRNGHGAGFWDGDWDIAMPGVSPHDPNGRKAADVLTAASKRFGECDLYVGDDGRVYVTPERRV